MSELRFAKLKYSIYTSDSSVRPTMSELADRADAPPAESDHESLLIDGEYIDESDSRDLHSADYLPLSDRIPVTSSAACTHPTLSDTHITHARTRHETPIAHAMSIPAGIFGYGLGMTAQDVDARSRALNSPSTPTKATCRV